MNPGMSMMQLYYSLLTQVSKKLYWIKHYLSVFVHRSKRRCSVNVEKKILSFLALVTFYFSLICLQNKYCEFRSLTDQWIRAKRIPTYTL